MVSIASKYALIDGKETVLIEAIPHASSNEVVCVFEDGAGNRRFVSKDEWDEGADEDERSIMLPRGCEQKLVDLAKEQGFICSFHDERNNGAPIKAEFSGTLRDRQQAAADALLCHEDGILMAPTGFGKTVIGAYIIAMLKIRTLVIVPKTIMPLSSQGFWTSWESRLTC